MLNNLRCYIMTAGLCLVASSGFAAIEEGSVAIAHYEKDKDSAQILQQKDKTFRLKKGDTLKIAPKEMRLKVGEWFFITNDEEKIVHNIYDAGDSSWLLTKQLPGGVVAINYDTPGVHNLRCAIHPKMKIKVTVVK